MTYFTNERFLSYVVLMHKSWCVRSHATLEEIAPNILLNRVAGAQKVKVTSSNKPESSSGSRHSEGHGDGPDDAALVHGGDRDRGTVWVLFNLNCGKFLTSYYIICITVTTEWKILDIYG